MNRTDLTYFERILGLLVIGMLSLACFKIIVPFLGAILWAVIIVVATWPLYRHLEDHFGYRSGRATALMTSGLVLLVIGPIALLTLSLSDYVQDVTAVLDDLTRVQLPEHSPDWMGGLPLVGDRIERLWSEAHADLFGFIEKLRPQIRKAAEWLLAQGAHLGLALLELLLALAISAVLYRNGAAAACWVARFAFRVGGEEALPALAIAASTVRRVAQGVVGTAALQAVLSAVGFALAGVPGLVLLTFFCFITAMLQIGTGLIWIPVALWLAHEGQQGWAVFTVGWGIFVNIIDNFIKPMLISHGSGLPLALIFMGVIGGLLAWGIIGIFVGPTLLATGYTLVTHWLESGPQDPGEANGPRNHIADAHETTQ